MLCDKKMKQASLDTQKSETLDLKDKIQEVLDYYIYEPEKTHAILQVHFLNKVYSVMDRVFFGVVDWCRPIVKFILRL